MGLSLITLLGLTCVCSPLLGEADGDGLFSTSDSVANLDSSNFRRTVTGTDHAWFVDFYSTWCGHCVRFAPVYKAFGRDIEDWYKVMRVGAIACSSTGNSQTCGLYDIWGYPTVKFFAPRSTESHTGTVFSGANSVDTLRQKALDYLEEWLLTHEAPPSWPALAPHSSVRNFVINCGNVQRRFLVADDDKYLGREVVLDFSYTHPAVCVGHMNRSTARQAGINIFPSLHLVASSGRTRTVTINTAGRKAMTAAIRSILSGQNVTDVSGSEATSETPSVTGGYSYTPPDGVYSHDLESAVYYSLWLEVGTHQTIEGERLAVLKHYIDILARYYPGPELVHNFINRTNAWLRGVTISLIGQQWLNQLNSFHEPGIAFVLKSERYIACRGSQSHFRGYPCSLWTLFHAITVNAEHIERQNTAFDPKEIPLLLNDYIQKFFGCRECAVNFGKAATTIDADVSSRTDGILWLWKSHNRANWFLHDDPTEDPHQAKIQFPSYASCALCRRAHSHSMFGNTTVWDEARVLQYLTRFYAKEHIKQRASSSSRDEVAVNPDCLLQSTEWSVCTHTCGVGTSHRMSNNNDACLMISEYRMCYIRPCGVTNWSHVQAYRLDHCVNHGATYQLMQPQTLAFGSCYSLSSYYFRFCGSCQYKCCHPVAGRTVDMPVICNGSHRTSVKMYIIEKCNCDNECPT